MPAGPTSTHPFPLLEVFAPPVLGYRDNEPLVSMERYQWLLARYLNLLGPKALTTSPPSLYDGSSKASPAPGR